MATEENTSESADYERLLREAQGIRGVSLWQDAWRRLRRNWAAMTSLYFLIALGLVAALTPMLPLQSPIVQDLKNGKFHAPNFETKSLRLSDDQDLIKAVTAYEKQVAALRTKLQKAAPDQQAAIREEFNQIQATDPLGVLWHKPGTLVRPMIRLRIAIFGNWAAPSVCGTDHLGRDLLARLFWGARVSLIVGLVAASVSLAIGVTYGAVAGFAGGIVDDIMMRIVDILYSVPFIFIVIFVLSVLNDATFRESFLPNVDKITIFYVLIGAIYWLTMARVVRGQVISLKHEQFVDAARVIGAGHARIVFLHLIPNVLSVVIVYLTLTIPAVMLFEAFLSFLGLGVDAPDVSWGLLANEAIKVITPIKVYWWLVLFPGLALASTLFALNFLGDGLRDALDPRMKNR